MPDDTEKLNATVQLIERFRGGLERRLPWNEIRKFIGLITEGHIFFGANLPEQVFYRGRVLSPGERFENIDELKAPPAALVRSYGRCNCPYQPVFYASSNLETVLSELGVAAGDRVQILECHPKTGSKISASIVGEIDHVRRYGTHSNATGPGFADQIREHWNNLNPMQRLRLNLVDAFIADKFRLEIRYSFEYKITSAFSEIIFSQKIDSLFNPSVGHRGGLNIAIRAKAAHEELEFTASKIIEVRDCLGYGLFGYALEAESQQIEEDGTIKF